MLTERADAELYNSTYRTDERQKAAQNTRNMHYISLFEYPKILHSGFLTMHSNLTKGRLKIEK